MTEELLEEYTEGINSETLIYSEISASQTFKIGTTGRNIRAKLKKLVLQCFRIGLPGIINVKINTVDSEGLPASQTISIGTFNGNLLTTASAGQDVEVEMQEVVLEKDTQYAIILEGLGVDGSDSIAWLMNSGFPKYVGGNMLVSVKSIQGGAWIPLIGSEQIFQVYGEPVKSGKGLPFGGKLMQARREARAL